MMCGVSAARAMASPRLASRASPLGPVSQIPAWVACSAGSGKGMAILATLPPREQKSNALEARSVELRDFKRTEIDGGDATQVDHRHRRAIPAFALRKRLNPTYFAEAVVDDLAVEPIGFELIPATFDRH